MASSIPFSRRGSRAGVPVLVAATLVLGLAGCGSDDESSDSAPATSAGTPDASGTTLDTVPIMTTPPPDTVSTDPLATVPPVVEEQGPAVLETIADLAYSHYSASLGGAEALKAAVDAFVADPTDAQLEATRQAWLAARPAYIRTEGLRFSGGPIDGGDVSTESFINAWPLDEVYVDSLIAGEEPISEEMLRAANEAGGERNISSGWHAIEYLLWGVDEDPAGPGDRPASDFVGDDPVPARSREYLQIATEMLVADIGKVAAEWDPEAGPYRQEFLAMAPRDGLRSVMTGIGTLAGGELFGQRLAVPYDTKDPEEEHSCFSDTTTIDHNMDAQSIRDIYLGLDADGAEIGPSLTDVVAAVDAALDARIREEIDAAVAATAAIPAPFDQAILGADDAPGRVAIKAALDALDTLTQDLIAAGRILGFQIGTEVP